MKFNVDFGWFKSQTYNRKTSTLAGSEEYQMEEDHLNIEIVAALVLFNAYVQFKLIFFLSWTPSISRFISCPATCPIILLPALGPSIVLAYFQSTLLLRRRLSL